MNWTAPHPKAMPKACQVLVVMLSLAAVAPVTAQPGNALDFDGSDDHVGGMNINQHLNNKITVSAWIKPSGFTSNDFQGIVTEEYDPNNTNVVFELFYDGTIDKFGAGFYKNGSWTKVFDANTYTTTGEWIFLTATYDGTDFKFYLNGEQVNSVRDTRGLPSGDHNWRIGSRHDHFNNNFTVPSNYFNGSIDEVRIWSEARTQQEIRDLMHQEINNPGSKSNLVAYYDFNSSSGTTLTDQAGSNDGTLTNMTTSGSGNDWVTSGAALTDNAKLEQGNTFHNDVRGIWPAKTTESSGGLTGNETSSSALVTKDNVVFGHDGATGQNTSPTNSNYDFSNVSANSLSAVANRQWFIDENAGGNNVDLTINTNDAGIGILPSGGNAGDYVLIEVKSSGKDVLIKTANSISSSNNTISFDNVDIKSTYTFGTTSSGSPLPVELTHFTVQQEDSRSARLEWSTASETNNSHFLVQRRSGDQWQEVGQVKGHGTTTVPRDYRFIDNGLTPGTHYYRLKQVDFDGSYEYSDVKAVTLRRDEASQTSALVVYPNPVGQTLNMAFTGNGGNRLRVTIRNAQGQMVYRNEWDGENEALRKALPVSGLQPGAYVLMLKGQNRVYRQRFLKR